MGGWNWKLRRLLAMPPQEIATRLWRAARDRAIAAGALKPYPIEPAECFAHAWNDPAIKIYQRFLHRFPCSRYSHTRWREFLRTQQASTAQSVLEDAEQILRGKMRLFTFDVQTDIPPNWFRNYVQGGEWQAVPASKMDYRRGDVAGGVRYCWELNRHGYFLTLAQAWFLTEDARFAERLVQDWLDWIERNPPRYGINWTSMLENALRIHTWCWSLWFLSDSPLLSEQSLQRILGSMWQQCAEIAMNLSVGSSANNHLIGEVAGMWTFASLFSSARHARRWSRTARRILWREVLKQITPDGVTVEQAVHYQVFVMEMALHAAVIAHYLGEPFDEGYRQRLLTAAHFLEALTDAAGNIAHIGDSDDAEVLPLAPETHDNAAAIVEAVKSFYDQNAPSTYKAAWLVGRPDCNKHREERHIESQLIAIGGYAVMRDAVGKRVAVIDCGELGWGSIAAHGHADALALTLSVDGEPILVDAGTYCYHDEPIWRDAFRSTLYHNTVCVDNTDQSQMLGAFLWGARAQVEVRRWHSSPLFDLLCAAHSGYQRIGCGWHIRWIIWLKPDIWAVVDEVEHSQARHMQQSWLFSQACVLKVLDDRMQVLYGDKALWILPTAPVRVAHVISGEPAEGGWMSPTFGRREPAPHLFLVRSEACGRMGTVMAVNSEPEMMVWRDDATGWELQVAHNDQVWLVGTGEIVRQWEIPGTTLSAKNIVAVWDTQHSTVRYEVLDGEH